MVGLLCIGDDFARIWYVKFTFTLWTRCSGQLLFPLHELPVLPTQVAIQDTKRPQCHCLGASNVDCMWILAMLRWLCVRSSRRQNFWAHSSRASWFSYVKILRNGHFWFCWCTWNDSLCASASQFCPSWRYYCEHWLYAKALRSFSMPCEVNCSTE